MTESVRGTDELYTMHPPSTRILRVPVVPPGVAHVAESVTSTSGMTGARPTWTVTPAVIPGERDVPDLDLIGLANEDHDADHPVGVVDLEELPAVEVAPHVLLGVVRLEQQR